MAKYTVNCDTCGTSFERVLFGPSKDRQWKLDQRQTCTDCWKKDQRSARDAEGPVIQVRARRGNPALMEFVVFNSFSVKDSLKSRGYRFSYRPKTCGAADFFAMNATEEGAWAIKFEGDPDVISDTVAAEINWLKSQDWKFEDATGPLAAIGIALVEGRPDLLEGK